eukprot:9040432-Pyramimonas_sp.AAC.1
MYVCVWCSPAGEGVAVAAGGGAHRSAAGGPLRAPLWRLLGGHGARGARAGAAAAFSSRVPLVAASEENYPARARRVVSVTTMGSWGPLGNPATMSSDPTTSVPLVAASDPTTGGRLLRAPHPSCVPRPKYTFGKEKQKGITSERRWRRRGLLLRRESVVTTTGAMFRRGADRRGIASSEVLVRIVTSSPRLCVERGSSS